MLCLGHHSDRSPDSNISKNGCCFQCIHENFWYFVSCCNLDVHILVWEKKHQGRICCDYAYLNSLYSIFQWGPECHVIRQKKKYRMPVFSRRRQLNIQLNDYSFASNQREKLNRNDNDGIDSFELLQQGVQPRWNSREYPLCDLPGLHGII